MNVAGLKNYKTLLLITGLTAVLAAVWVCPVSTDSLPLGHSTSSQSNLFVL